VASVVSKTSPPAQSQAQHSPARDIPVEEVPCYLCGSREGKVLVDDPPFKVIECAGCGLGYTSPRLHGDRIHEIYGEQYWRSDSAKDFGYSCYEDEASGYLRTFEMKADLLARYLPQGRILEVGSAAGYFLAVMKARGYEVHGLEISREVAASSRERFGLPDVQSCFLADANYESASFDVIAMWDVIEHMADPLADLRHCHRLLHDEGLLVLQTQDVTSLARKILGRRWHHFKQMEHIYHFSPATIRELLGRADFDVLEITRRKAGKYISWEFVVERSARLGRLAALICRPFKLLGRRFFYVNPFDEIVVVARKQTAPAPEAGA